MTKEQYIKITKPLRDNPKATKILSFANHICTAAAYVLYPMLLIYFAWNRQAILARAIMVPLDSFIILTVFRYLVNAKRPYEVFEMPPVLKKDTKGKSFPSRHVFSIVIIAMTYLLISPWVWVGIVLLILSFFLGLIRVFAGIHFPRDVIAGAICGVVAGILGFLVL